MRYSNKDAIQITSAEMLQDICEKRLAVRHQRYHRDCNGRAIWSYDIFESIFTYYLYNDQGLPIEIGHTYMPQFTLDKFIAMGALPDADLIDYIVNSYLSYNISLLQPVPQTIATQVPQLEIKEITASPVPNGTTGSLPIDPVGNILTFQQSKNNPQHQIHIQPGPETITNHTTDTSFADHVLHTIFSAFNPIAERPECVKEHTKTEYRDNSKSIFTGSKSIQQKSGPIRIRPSPGYYTLAISHY